MPTIPAIASPHHRRRRPPTFVKRSTAATQVAPAKVAWPDGNGSTGRMHETVGRSRAVDDRFHHGAEQRRQTFGDRVRQQGPPPPGHDQDDADPGDQESTPEPTSQIVEDQRHVLQERRLDLAHPVGPVLFDRERLGGDEECRHDEERQESRSQRQRTLRAQEEALVPRLAQEGHRHSLPRNVAGGRWGVDFDRLARRRQRTGPKTGSRRAGVNRCQAKAFSGRDSAQAALRRSWQSSPQRPWSSRSRCSSSGTSPRSWSRSGRS